VRHFVAGIVAVISIAGFAFAAGTGRLPSAPPPDGGASDGGTDGPPPGGYLPDPPPLTTRHQWVLDLAFRSGDVSVRAARRVELGRPTPTARMMGRFAIELYVGRELMDRVRFNFPLLGAGDTNDDNSRWDAPPSFERALTTSAAVMIPHSERATRATIVDRATGRQWPIRWPPVGGDAGPAGSVTRH
jgi:hypothetical protein